MFLDIILRPLAQSDLSVSVMQNLGSSSFKQYDHSLGKCCRSLFSTASPSTSWTIHILESCNLYIHHVFVLQNDHFAHKLLEAI